MKRIIAFILSALMVLSLSGCLGGADTIEINSVNFPDEVVLRKVKQFDKNSDGKLNIYGVHIYIENTTELIW